MPQHGPTLGRRAAAASDGGGDGPSGQSDGATLTQTRALYLYQSLPVRPGAPVGVTFNGQDVGLPGNSQWRDVRPGGGDQWLATALAVRAAGSQVWVIGDWTVLPADVDTFQGRAGVADPPGAFAQGDTEFRFRNSDGTWSPWVPVGGAATVTGWQQILHVQFTQGVSLAEASLTTPVDLANFEMLQIEASLYSAAVQREVQRVSGLFRRAALRLLDDPTHTADNNLYRAENAIFANHDTGGDHAGVFFSDRWPSGTASSTLALARINLGAAGDGAGLSGSTVLTRYRIFSQRVSYHDLRVRISAM